MQAMVVHGGAGTTPTESRQREACERALAIGWEILAGGGRAVDAVARAVMVLEDDPALNAGFGAYLTEAGTVELDASIMEGARRAAGAVALVSRLRNPIAFARSLMEDGPHVFMAGVAAEALAAKRGFTLVDPEALVAPDRRRSWEERLSGRGVPTEGPKGTVGAVALDADGHVAAATSTGGIAMKHPGRIGDSAVIGAGTFADDRSGAASSTGDGEAIMRAGLAHAAVALLRSGLEPFRAAAMALAEVTAVGDTAGIILVDRLGRFAAVHTTPHMTWCSRRD